MRQWRTHNASLVKFHATSETQLTKRKSCSSRTQVTQPKRMSSLSLASLFSLSLSLSLARTLLSSYSFEATWRYTRHLHTHLAVSSSSIIQVSSNTTPIRYESQFGKFKPHAHLLATSHTFCFIFFFPFRSPSFLLDAPS